jgi:protein involved in polysaccharide export with SLBB domain
MRKTYLIFITTISIFTSSQEIDEKYLNSLPESIREDVLNKIDSNVDSEKNIYRSINVSSDISKNMIDDEVFGSQFFDTLQTSFMPINTPNLDDEYILDFGDILSIHLVGESNAPNDYMIERDGSIDIPDVGKLYLAGISLAEASKMITSRVEIVFFGVDVYTSLKNIRDISILVAGDAENPGIYTLNGNSNILHALHSAGGVSEYGSYRSIKLIRDDKVIDAIDIYDILIEGKVGSNTRLRSGDVIFVEPRSNIIDLEGAFNRPGKYELLKGQNLSDAIHYANGVSVEADTSNIFLHRLLDAEIRSLPISIVGQFNNIEANDKDRVFIRAHSFRNVNISGSVLRPGNYKMVEGENIFDLIEKSGGYTLNAFPEGAIYLNDEAKIINENASKKLYDDFIDSLLQIMQSGFNSESDIAPIIAIAEQLKDSTSNGRIIIDLLDDTTKTLIKNNDSLFIPEKNNNIFIYGDITNEGSLIYKKGADLDFYINEASGLKDTADNNAIYILFPNGRTQQFTRKRNIFANQPQKIIIEPGSVIYVPRKVENTLSSRISAQAYASILSSLGVTLASISAINNNN